MDGSTRLEGCMGADPVEEELEEDEAGELNMMRSCAGKGLLV
jgi:hypothetical protein